MEKKQENGYEYYVCSRCGERIIDEDAECCQICGHLFF